MHFPRRAERLTRDLDRLRRKAFAVPRSGASRQPVPETSVKLAEVVGLDLDDWQGEYLDSPSGRRILNICRQAGKSTVAAVSGLYDALVYPGSLVLIIAPSERQSLETFRKVAGIYHRLGYVVPAHSERKLGMELLNGSRIEALPGSEKTTRGFSAPRRIIADEASRIPDELYAGVLPMLARSGGSLDLLSTPAGKAGFFYETWTAGVWASWEVPATMIPHRIPPAFLEEQRRIMDERYFRQEFLCEFLDVEDAVFSGELIERATGHDVADTGGFEWTA